MIKQSRIREQFDRLITRLSERPNDASTATCFLLNSDQIISIFDGSTEDTVIAEEWLKSLETSKCLNKWPEQYCKNSQTY